MAQPESEQRPLTDDEIDEGRERLADWFDEVAEGLASENGRSADEFRPERD